MDRDSLFLVLFVSCVIVSGFLIAKTAETIQYQTDVERAVQLSKETPDVQRYVDRYPGARHNVFQDEHYWIVDWGAPGIALPTNVVVYIDKVSWEIFDVEVFW